MQCLLYSIPQTLLLIVKVTMPQTYKPLCRIVTRIELVKESCRTPIEVVKEPYQAPNCQTRNLALSGSGTSGRQHNIKIGQVGKVGLVLWIGVFWVLLEELPASY